MRKIYTILLLMFAFITCLKAQDDIALERARVAELSKQNKNRATTASAIEVQASTGKTAAELVEDVFMGEGVNINNVKFNGISTTLTTSNGLQIGTFTANTSTFAPAPFFSNGLILTTGNIDVALGPNSSGGKSNQISYTTPSCSELSALIPGYTANNPAVLEFDFVTVSDHVAFNYVFASEEYPEFACSNYNDVFGFFVTDTETGETKNIALIPGTNTIVSINSVHPYSGSCDAAAYSQYYTTVPSNSELMQYDGYVGPLTAEMNIVPCRTYHIKLAIANAGDKLYDSGVFLEAKSFSAPVLGGTVNYEYSDQQYIVPGCYEADITFALPDPVENDSLIELFYSGTAINGVHVEEMPSSILMPAGDSTYTLHVSGISDGQYHGDTLLLTISYHNEVCAMSMAGEINIYIVRDNGIELSSENINSCSDIESMSVQITNGEATNIQWSPATNLTNPHSLTTGFINPPGIGTTQYTVTATDKYGCSTAQTSFTLNISSPIEQTINEHICQGYHYTGYGIDTIASEPGLISQTVLIPSINNDCGILLNLNLTVDPPLTETINITECNSYVWTNGTGETYTQSGNYYYNTQTEDGCDKTITLNLTINYPDQSTANVTECDSYTWNGTTYTQSGVYTYNTQTVNGCDSTATLNLTINHAEQSTTDITECDSYTWNGTTYTQSGVYTYNTQTALGCDSTATLNLTINESEYPEEIIAACDAYEWNDNTYQESGTYTFETTTDNGCERIETLYLTIEHSQYPEETVTACDSYEWNGMTLTASDTYTYETTTAAGCEQIETLYLTVNYSDQSTTDITECDSYTWNGTTYTQSGVYPYYTQTALGCDSTANLNLTINNSEYPVEDVTNCLSYSWNGNTYQESGTYTFETTTANGCERIETLYLTIEEAPDFSIEGDHYPIGGSETNFSIYNYIINSLNSLTEYDSVTWTIGCENWFIEEHNNGMDINLHIFTFIDEPVPLTATAYNHCGTYTFTFWINTSYYNINENTDNNVSITPNPNNGEMTITIDDMSKNATVNVIDNNGRLIDQFSIPYDSKNFRYDMKNKAAGNYNFIITHDNEITTKKVIVK